MFGVNENGQLSLSVWGPGILKLSCLLKRLPGSSMNSVNICSVFDFVFKTNFSGPVLNGLKMYTCSLSTVNLVCVASTRCQQPEIRKWTEDQSVATHQLSFFCFSFLYCIPDCFQPQSLSGVHANLHTIPKHNDWIHTVK